MTTEDSSYGYVDLPAVDNGTLYVTVPTPEGWKCDREGCTTDFYHTHSTYTSLLPKE